MTQLITAFLLMSIAGLTWGDPCIEPPPDRCYNVGCVNEEVRRCKAEAELNKLGRGGAGKENINLCLLEIAGRDGSLSVAEVIAALVTCENKEAFES